MAESIFKLFPVNKGYLKFNFGDTQPFCLQCIYLIKKLINYEKNFITKHYFYAMYCRLSTG